MPRFDQHLPLMSLPHALRLPDPSDPAVPSPPYLRADPEKTRVWRSRLLPTGNLRVGLVWAGNDKHPRDRERSIPAALLAPFAAIPGVTFYSLQLRRPGIASAPDALLAVDFTPQLTDFSESAALVGELDLVISVDTAVAHLAGALDKPVWTLLDFAADWRWGTDGSCTAWYGSMRLFRQSTPGDWPAVLRQVAAELATLANVHP